MSKRSTRFLIDRIDERLGSVEKEIKFDKIAIAVSVLVLIIGVVMSTLSMNNGKGAIGILGILITMAGVAILYAMVKELISDIKKANKK
jgi:protein-S-isoprenylcysteine O-methyltransferase Ste14